MNRITQQQLESSLWGEVVQPPEGLLSINLPKRFGR
jgi:hypothetical protein